MPKNILVVDNNPVILKLMDNFLTKEGHQVQTAINGLIAIEVLKKFHPEIIFVDLIMPKISGEKLCSMLRTMPEMAGVVIIILSAAAVEQEIDFKSFGADACIAKGPFKEVEKHINFVVSQIDQGKISTMGDHVIGADTVYGRTVTTELLSSRKHFEITLNHMAEGFIELTEEGRIVYVNPMATTLLGHSEEKLLTKEFTALFAGKQKKLLSDCLTNLKHTPITIGEKPPFMHNGKYIAMTMVAIAEQIQTSNIIIIQDITARKMAEQELYQSHENLENLIQQRTEELVNRNRELENEINERLQLTKEKKALETELRQAHKMEAIGTMATGIAHDFNNLLTSILGYTELLRLETEDNSQTSSHLQNITRASYRAKELIGLIKTFSRPSEQEFMSVKLPMVIGESLALLKPSVPSNIKIKANLNPKSPPVWADAVQIQQVILNLCTNAIRAMHQTGGVLTVNLAVKTPSIPTDSSLSRADQLKEFVEISVADTGVGISPADIDKIFDPYFTTRIGGEGTGLGLTVVHGIVSHHGGRITVDSTLGKGSKFSVILPVRPEEYLPRQ